MKPTLKKICLSLLLSIPFQVFADIETYDSGVFFKVSDEPTSISFKYDNSSTAWSLTDEKNDLDNKDIENYFTESREYYSHFLYGYRDFTFSTDAEDLGLLNIVNHCSVPPFSCVNQPVSLESRTPLILIHGWQGSNGVNNYLGFNKQERLPEQYFMELLAFYNSGEPGLGGGSLEAQAFFKRYKIYLFHYPSFEHITYNGRMLGEAISRVPELVEYMAKGKKIVMAGHSMEGLVARSFIEEHGVSQYLAEKDSEGNIVNDESNDFNGVLSKKLYEGEDVVEALITLATPHHGTPAPISEWIEWNVIAGKEISSPGALDLYWDDFDEVINDRMNNSVEFNNMCFSHYINNVCYWPNRQKADRFDIFYARNTHYITPKLSGYTNPDGSIVYIRIHQYNEPNPWLRNLNNKFSQNQPNVNYYLYGGSVVINNDLNDILKETIAFLHFDFGDAAGVVARGSNYNLNDSVVPTVSAFLDHGQIWTNDKSDIGKRNNFVRFLENQDFTGFLFKEGENNPGGPNNKAFFRYFHDYDHDKMRGGSGNLDVSKGLNPASYGDDWKDSDQNHLNLNELIHQVGSEITKYVDFGSSRDRLIYEPLFLKVALDLQAIDDTREQKYESQWSDITKHTEITKSKAIYDRFNKTIYSFINISNTCEGDINGPIRMVIKNPVLPVLNDPSLDLSPDGFSTDGDPYFIITKLGDSIINNTSTGNLRINFEMPARLTRGLMASIEYDVEVQAISENVGCKQSSGLIAHYSFNNPGNLGFDETGSTDGVGSGGIIGVPTSVVSNNGSTIHISQDNYIRVPYADSYIPNNDSFTIATQFYAESSASFSSAGNIELLTIQGGDFGEGLWFGVFDPSNPTFRFGINPNAPGVGAQYLTAPVALGQWHHAVGVVDRTNNNASLYLDGQLVLQENLNDLGFGSIDPTMDMLIGAYDYTYARNGHSQVDSGDVLIDDLRIYNRSLSSEEITGLHKEHSLAARYLLDGNANDSGINNTYDGIEQGGVDLTGSAGLFDGVDDSIALPDSLDTLKSNNAKSVFAWVKIPAGVSSAECSGWGYLRSVVDNSPAGHWRYLGIHIRDGVYKAASGIQAHQTYVEGDTLTPDTWHLIGFTWSPDSALRVYTDNNAPVSSPNTIPTWDTVAGSTFIGRQYSNPCGHYFEGAIKDVRFYDRQLKDSEVDALYNSGNTTP